LSSIIEADSDIGDGCRDEDADMFGESIWGAEDRAK